MKLNKADPYAILFSLGLFSSVLGVFVWLFLKWGWIDFYPRSPHASVMFFGFLWSYVAGFLMTAVPKMTGSERASPRDVKTMCGLILLQILFSIMNHMDLAVICFAVQLLFLMYFVGNRFYQSRTLPFEGFVFVPFAFVCGLVAVIYYFVFSKDYLVFSLLAGQALILNLICGVGSRMIPVFSRVQNALSPQQGGATKKYLWFLLMAMFLNSSFLIEGMGNETLGILIRALFLIYFAIFYFKIFHKTTSRSYLGWGVRCGVVFMILGYLLAALLDSSYYLSSLHLVFIPGFALITLMISTRVTLAHGGVGTDLEITAKPLLYTMLLFVLSGIFRFFIYFSAENNYLYTSITFFILAISAWCFLFFKILMSPLLDKEN